MEAPAPPVRFLAVYRISSGGYAKQKPAYITKQSCLTNFLESWKLFVCSQPRGLCRLHVIADNCSESLFRFVQSSVPRVGVHVERTSFGNGAASFRRGVELASSADYDDDCRVYFVEDDYLHKEDAIACIFQGLDVCDFCTGYDHPDKYGARFGPEGQRLVVEGIPLVQRGAEQGTKVYLGRSCHYRTSNSTTMTFACKCSTLRRAKNTMNRWISGSHPHDFQMFLDLIQTQGFELCVTLPARSTHGETAFLAPNFEGDSWENIGKGAVLKSKKAQK